MELLTAVSSFMSIADERHLDPLTPRDQQAYVTLRQLVETFVETPFAETTAALMVIRALTGDELVRAQIDRELVRRRHPMPVWLTRLGETRVEPDVWFLTHVQGDGDDYVVGVELPGGAGLAALIYVDHNMGTVVKDAFPIAETASDVAITIGTAIETDQTLTKTDPAMARAVVEKAIEHGARIFPPLESESWPLCRPLVEWMVRMLPGGALAPERKEWTEEETAAVAEQFFVSPFGKPLADDREAHDLLDSILWFGTGYATGDPFTWSPVTVELIMADWFPRKIMAEPAYLTRLPEVLRPYIRFCHDKTGLRAALTQETLAAVDHWEPGYQREIRSERAQGALAMARALVEGGRWDEPSEPDERTLAEIMLDELARRVGGRVVLENLDDAPLPDEEFLWAGVPDDIRAEVGEVLEHCDRLAEEMLDVELRTAMRRFLGRAAVADPAIFRRRASSARGAAAVAWAVCNGNDDFGRLEPDAPVRALQNYFGVKAGLSDRAASFLAANGVLAYQDGPLALGAPDLLTSRIRGSFIRRRDRWLEDF